MSIQNDLFQQLSLIRTRRRANLPVDKRTMSMLRPAPEVTLVLGVQSPDGVRETLLSLDAQEYRQFEVVLVNYGFERIEGLLQDIGLPVSYLRTGEKKASAEELAARIGRSRRVVLIEPGSVYPPGYMAGLVGIMVAQQ